MFGAVAGLQFPDRVCPYRTVSRQRHAFRNIRAVVRELDAGLPLVAMKTVEQQLDESLVTERMIASLSSVFGVLATVLAIIGLYGVMAYMVERRSREIGIRMALGAQPGGVVWLVMGEVLLLVIAGLAAGLPAAWFLTQLVRAQLYGVQPNDPLLSIAAATAAIGLLWRSWPDTFLARRRCAAAYDPYGFCATNKREPPDYGTAKNLTAGVGRAILPAAGIRAGWTR